MSEPNNQREVPVSQEDGERLVTHWNLCLTILGFSLYILDIGSDIGTSIYYASSGQWWQSMVTLAFVYGVVIIHIAVKWKIGDIHCTGAIDWLRYVASLLVNWPNVKQYGTFCLLEWKLYKSPSGNAHMVSEWRERRGYVTFLKFLEGLWEACPQSILQIYLLLPDLYGDWTWTDYLRIASASVSLCAAGAAFVNSEKMWRFLYNIDLPLSELIVLHVWMTPVIASRLLSVTLLLTVHPYWVLAGVFLHLVLCSAYWCITWAVPRALKDVMAICLSSLRLLISPFELHLNVSFHRAAHAIHFLGNTAMTVVWTLRTPLVCAHPALYTGIICFNAVMFTVGLIGMVLSEKYWGPPVVH